MSLTVIEGGLVRSYWLVRCFCGNIKRMWGDNVKRGRSKSCGCMRQTFAKGLNYRHGKYGTREYRSWRAMVQRCYDPKAVNYKYYGGKGIKVCDRWREFSKFFEDMGSRPSNTTLDRIDSTKNYEPLNCRWASPFVQMRHRRKYERSN